MANITRKSRIWIIITCVVLSLVLIGTAVWFLSADWRQYQKGIILTELKQYDAALEIFTDLGEYSNAKVWVLQVRYEMADQIRAEGDVLDAAKQFEALGDYEDSPQRALACYYAHAFVKKAEKDFDTALQYFLLAKEYQDAPYQHQMACYEAGHAAFLAGEYELAEGYFEMLEKDITAYGVEHFVTIDDAAEFLAQQRLAAAQEFRFCIAEYEEKDVLESLKNYLSSFSESYYYLDTDNIVTIYVNAYYPGDKILRAHRTGDTSFLSDAELQTYQLALDLVAQAQKESDSQLEVELWLHDWLCQKIKYESPDMEVPVEQFIQLRQLTCVGALLDGKANCQGYTDAFYLLGNLAGLEVQRMFGKADEGHCWNVVKLDGQWYIVDVTFDDSETMTAWNYVYFNVPWDPDTYEIYGGAEVLPELASKDNSKYSYYHINGLYYKDGNEAIKYLSNKIAVNPGKVVTVRFKGRSTNNQVIGLIKLYLQYYYSGTINTVCIEYDDNTYVFAKFTKK